MLDEKDIKIINSLLKNSRSSTTTISKDLALSNVATQQRISKLEKNGTIKSYTATIDYEKVEYKTIAYLGIFLDKAKDYPDVIDQLNKVPQIAEAHFTTGNYSIFAKIYAKSNNHLMEILSKRIQNIDGVARTETFISLQEGINKPVYL
jgi:Lrp/AsnC family transcriptional regulator for asnA, asnC and gidA